ncbi:hypothetical protein B0O99DRAFT_357641 [Bisporella sp. PMI_857]|nr:hypothetical protein B0O99DRAFT_357641 [Bisporella sp. PMI_857]
MDSAPNPYGKIVEIRKLLIKEYVVRERSFTKRELLPEQLQTGPDGKPWPWKWGKQRLLNEAYALDLVKKYTNIPVPKLLDFGVDDQGRTFLTWSVYTTSNLKTLGRNAGGLLQDNGLIFLMGNARPVPTLPTKTLTTSSPTSSFHSFNSSRPKRPD